MYVLYGSSLTRNAISLILEQTKFYSFVSNCRGKGRSNCTFSRFFIPNSINNNSHKLWKLAKLFTNPLHFISTNPSPISLILMQKNIAYSIKGMAQMSESEFPYTYLLCCHMLSVSSHEKWMFRIISKHCLCQFRTFSYCGLKIRPEACNFIKKETLPQVFSCEFSKAFKNFFYRTPLWVTASRISKTNGTKSRKPPHLFLITFSLWIFVYLSLYSLFFRVSVESWLKLGIKFFITAVMYKDGENKTRQ